MKDVSADVKHEIKPETRLERYQRNKAVAKKTNSPSDESQEIVKVDDSVKGDDYQRMALDLMQEPKSSSIVPPALVNREGLGPQISADATVGVIALASTIDSGFRYATTKKIVGALKHAADKDCEARILESNNKKESEVAKILAQKADNTAKNEIARQDVDNKHEAAMGTLEHKEKKLNHTISKDTEELAVRKREIALEERKFETEQETRSNGWGCSIM